MEGKYRVPTADEIVLGFEGEIGAVVTGGMVLFGEGGENTVEGSFVDWRESRIVDYKGMPFCKTVEEQVERFTMALNNNLLRVKV